MEKTMIACAFLIAITIQWQAHYSKDTVSFWADLVPTSIVIMYLINRFLNN